LDSPPHHIDIERSAQIGIGIEFLAPTASTIISLAGALLLHMAAIFTTVAGEQAEKWHWARFDN